MNSNGDKNIDTWAKLIAADSIYTKYLENLGGASAMQKWTESLAGVSSISKHLKDIEANSSWNKLAKSLTASNALSAHLKDIEANSSWNKLAESLTASNALSERLKNIEANISWSKLAKSLTVSRSFNKYLKELDGASSFHKWAESVATSSAFAESIERLKRADYLEPLLEDIEKESSSPSASIDAELAAVEDLDVDELLRQMASTGSPNGFSKLLEQAPRVLKWLLFSFLLSLVWQLLIGAASGVIGNLVTPYIQAYLDGAKATPQREQIKAIKKLSFAELGIELSGYRFVTTNTLFLRDNPNARAPIVGELKFGQVVGVLSTRRDWTEVVYEYGDGTTTVGWVFTRYTAKFRS